MADMPMRKRKASFIGSAEWVKKDVQEIPGGFRDKPSGISTSSTLPDRDPEAQLARLAHRVKQFN